jgi:nicotinate-nucleotide pyrophosphorylase (carboxylating)
VSLDAPLPPIDAIVAAALAEDLGVEPDDLLARTSGLLDRDVTGSLLPAGARFAGAVRVRADGVVCGLPVAARAFEMLAEAAGVEAPECFPLVHEGAQVRAGDAVLEVAGGARVVLAAERTALDFLMVLSGMATRAAAWQEAAGPELRVLDTRKTVPGLRALSKYAVRVGGASNHRAGLYDMVLVKDNHVRAAGGIARAVSEARASHPGLVVEVEADTAAQAAEAAAAGADLVLLDNMDDARLTEAVTAVQGATPAGGRCEVEASGGVTIERLPRIAAAGVDRVSASALTLAPPLDFGLDAAEADA